MENIFKRKHTTCPRCKKTFSAFDIENLKTMVRLHWSMCKYREPVNPPIEKLEPLSDVLVRTFAIVPTWQPTIEDVKFLKQCGVLPI